MNKKLVFIFLFLAVSIIPIVSFAASGDKNLGFYAEKVMGTARSIATPIVVIGWIIAGILYLTAAGAPDKINLAKGAVKACVIGTVLVVLAMASNSIIDLISNSFGLTADTSQTNNNGSSRSAGKTTTTTDSNGVITAVTKNGDGSKTTTITDPNCTP